MSIFDSFKRKELNEIEHLKKVLVEKEEIIKIYQPIIDLEVAIKDAQTKYADLKNKYDSGKQLYDSLSKEIAVFENKTNLFECGIYQPVFSFERSDEYRDKQNKIIQEQKNLVLNDNAAKCDTKWTIGDDSRKGEAVIKKYKSLMLRAFNGECDSLITKVKWNNFENLKERINKTFETLNKLGAGFNVYITTSYRNLKIDELILEHEYNLKVKEEKEKMKAIQDELREEEKPRRDFEKAQKEAEKNELAYQKALEKAQREITTATDETYEKLKNQITELENELRSAKEKKERALSMAQQTKRGHVYIISNIGAFGENVYKIGMTRRLEPIDRVKELGDASVPFQFDIHAMIYSDEARTLEYELHKAFSNKKINMLNYRKEFFKVTLEEIEETIKLLGFQAEFIKIPEAMEYRETVALLERINTTNEILPVIEESPFPSTLDEDDQ